MTVDLEKYIHAGQLPRLALDARGWRLRLPRYIMNMTRKPECVLYHPEKISQV
jgi:hypothetical protein